MCRVFYAGVFSETAADYAVNVVVLFFVTSAKKKKHIVHADEFIPEDGFPG